MNDIIDPFDDPSFRPGEMEPTPPPQLAAGSAGSPQQGGLIDPFDDPAFMPGGRVPRQQPLSQGRGEVLSSGEALRRVGGSVGRFITGEGKMDFPDMPDIAEVFVQSAAQGPEGLTFTSPAAAGGGNENTIRLGLLAASEPSQVVDIALANLPGATATQDSQGNPIIDWQGQQYYAWKPGFRLQDAQRLAAQGAAYGGATGVGVKVGGGLLSRVASILGLNAATSAGLDLAAGTAGSDQGVSAPRALMAAGGGALAESLRPVANAAIRAFGRENVLDATGAVRPEVSEMLREQGVELSQDQAAIFADMMRRSTDPVAAGRVAQSQTLPVPVPETLGTATRDPAQQMTENLAREGVYGGMAQEIAERAQNAQAGAIRENVPAIQSVIGGGQRRVTGKGEAGEMAQANLLAQQERAKGAVDTLYDRARDTPAAMRAEGVDEFAGRLNEAAGPFVQANDTVRGQLELLRGMSEAGDVSVDGLFKWRKNVSALANAPRDMETGAGLRQLLRAFDDNVEETVRAHLMAGDEAAARSWMRAIKGRRNMGERFQRRSSLVEELVEREAGSQRGRLAVAPEAASNLIFGKANLGFASRPELTRELFQLRKTLGRNSDAWQALREEAFLRFAANLEGAQAGGAVSVSGAKAKTAWERASRDAAPVLRELFNDSERALITQFFKVAERITNPVRGGRAWSGTPQGLADIVKQMNNALFVGEKGQAVLSRIFPRVFEFVQDSVQSQRIGATMSGNPRTVLPLRQPVPEGAMGAAGAVTGREGGNYLSPNQNP